MKYMDTPIGRLLLEADDSGITRGAFIDAAALPPRHASLLEGGAERSEAEGVGEVPGEARRIGYLDEAERQLTEYFDGRRKSFDLPLSRHGTPFQMAVWAALCDIPYGETRSYIDIARQLGKPGGARAVGMANNRNPISIIVPCHRVIGADGKLVGYGGGLDRKAYLLRLEGHAFPG